ncbi:hypothetical protein AGMMS49579_09270 [Spirochaetia bacterium]|nr:hypothetical protein AGMMS49579_09270 [Spirochaetia bacterium]
MTDKNQNFGKILIEDIFTIPGRGTVITGKVSEGTFKLNDKVLIAGCELETQKSTITGIEMFNKLLDEAKEGDNVGLLLKGIKAKSIAQGQLVTNCLDQELVDQWTEELCDSDDEESVANDENPEVRAHIEKGDAFLEKEKYDKAITEYSEALKIEPENTEVLSERSAAYTLNEEYVKARSDLKKWLGLITSASDYDEDDDETKEILSAIYFCFGRTYFIESKWEKALEFFDKAVETNNENAMAYQLRGYVHFFKDDEDKAEEDFKKAIKLDPDLEVEIKEFKADDSLDDNEGEDIGEQKPVKTPQKKTIAAVPSKKKIGISKDTAKNVALFTVRLGIKALFGGFDVG